MIQSALAAARGRLADLDHEIERLAAKQAELSARAEGLTGDLRRVEAEHAAAAAAEALGEQSDAPELAAHLDVLRAEHGSVRITLAGLAPRLKVLHTRRAAAKEDLRKARNDARLRYRARAEREMAEAYASFLETKMRVLRSFRYQHPDTVTRDGAVLDGFWESPPNNATSVTLEPIAKAHGFANEAINLPVGHFAELSDAELESV